MSRSCGCLSGEQASARFGKHHLSTSPEYAAWAAFSQRCGNPKHQGFKHYGARGIKVCERWKEFENFLADMGERPGPGFSIDRIDVDGDYCPENCRWTDWKTQRNNTTRSIYLEHDGLRLTLKEWAARLQIHYNTLHGRVLKGWTAEQVLTTPTRLLTEEQAQEIRTRYAAGGVLQRELAAEYGISKQAVGDILHRRRYTALP